MKQDCESQRDWSHSVHNNLRSRNMQSNCERNRDLSAPVLDGEGRSLQNPAWEYGVSYLVGMPIHQPLTRRRSTPESQCTSGDQVRRLQCPRSDRCEYSFDDLSQHVECESPWLETGQQCLHGSLDEQREAWTTSLWEGGWMCKQFSADLWQWNGKMSSFECCAPCFDSCVQACESYFEQCETGLHATASDASSPVHAYLPMIKKIFDLEDAAQARSTFATGISDHVWKRTSRWHLLKSKNWLKSFWHLKTFPNVNCAAILINRPVFNVVTSGSVLKATRLKIHGLVYSLV